MCSGYDGWDTAQLTDGSRVLALDSGTPGLFAEVTEVAHPTQAPFTWGSFTDPVPTPEPGSCALLLTGLLLVGLGLRGSVLLKAGTKSHKTGAQFPLLCRP